MKSTDKKTVYPFLCAMLGVESAQTDREVILWRYLQGRLDYFVSLRKKEH